MLLLSRRARPGALLTDRRNLYEVTVRGRLDYKPVAVLEDCRTGRRLIVDVRRLNFWPWRLVRHAPRVPDTPDLIHAD